MPRAARPDAAWPAGAGRPPVRLLLVAAGEAAGDWVAGLDEAGFDPRVVEAEDVAGIGPALRDPLDAVIAWDDGAGTRAAAAVAAVQAENASVPVTVVAHPDAEDGVLRALAEGAAAALESGRPRRLPAELHRILDAEWLQARVALTGRIAHDLNNLLAPIPLAVQLLERAAAPSAVRGQLDSVQTATRRSMDAVKELSELLAADAVEPVRVRAKHLLALAARPWRQLAEPSTVLTDYPPDLPPVRVDLVRILQVLWCLARRVVDGAGEAAEGGGALLFSARDAGRAAGADAGVEIRVVLVPSPGSEGRPVDDPARAPGPADRLDAVLEVVAAEGGSVSVLAGAAGRTGYALLLPAAGRGPAGRLPSPPERRAGAAEGRPPAQGEGARSGPRGAVTLRGVLVIDGDPEVRRMARETLESAGWEVVTAVDGTEGVALYADNLDTVGAVLVDLTLPYMDGLATIRALRRIGDHATMVLTTGDGARVPRLERQAGGPDAVLTKPYDATSLLRALG